MNINIRIRIQIHMDPYRYGIKMAPLDSDPY